MHQLATLAGAKRLEVIMTMQRQSAYSGWTEDELHAEIRRIGSLLREASALQDERSRCAASYLGQLLREREENLATLRARRKRLS